jgi:hypothetical protein
MPPLGNPLDRPPLQRLETRWRDSGTGVRGTHCIDLSSSGSSSGGSGISSEHRGMWEESWGVVGLGCVTVVWVDIPLL